MAKYLYKYNNTNGISFLALFYGLNETEYALSYVFNPVKILGEIVFKDFGYTANISYSKIIILFSELLTIFSFFTLGVTIKNLYEFKY